MKIGSHVSIAGGVYNAPKRAADLGGETFQIFTRSPQGGKAQDLTDSVIENFKEEMERYGITEFVVHAPYFINFGSSRNNVFYGSVSIIKDELERSSQLGARYLMTHLGTYKEIGEEKGVEQVIKGLSKALEKYNGSTKFLLEIAAGAGDVIGQNFKQLERFAVELEKYPGFGGVCFDTQHAFASGYELRNPAGIKKTFNEFDEIIGLQYLRMSHINDSKIELGGRRDRHDHVGEGHIGVEGFANFLAFVAKMEKKHKTEMPLILETEHDKVQEDIIKLKAIRDEIKK